MILLDLRRDCISLSRGTRPDKRCVGGDYKAIILTSPVLDNGPLASGLFVLIIFNLGPLSCSLTPRHSHFNTVSFRLKAFVISEIA